MRTGGGQEEDTRWFWCPESEICDLHSHLFDGRNVSPLYRNTPKERISLQKAEKHLTTTQFDL